MVRRGLLLCGGKLNRTAFEAMLAFTTLPRLKTARASVQITIRVFSEFGTIRHSMVSKQVDLRHLVEKEYGTVGQRDLDRSGLSHRGVLSSISCAPRACERQLTLDPVCPPE